uniref:Palmitoyltransferase n=1 Tax=Tetraodon nigroviridis TaxID=99883 RepID=H3BYC7_TETNG
NMLRSVFGSGFAVRTAHVVLTWLITLILFLHDTELRRQEQPGQPGQPVLFVLLVLVSVLLYLAVSLMDPGFILAEDAGLQDPAQRRVPAPPACAHCLVQQPMRSKHCQACRRCVRRYDHHCPWMENCVGERSHRWFMLYLLVQLLVLLWGLHIASTGFQAGGAWRPWLRANGSHLYLISLNTTTWEFMCRHRISYLRHCGADQNPFDRAP